ncbi:MAG: amino acid-binding domain protein [Evtepia sp.]|jgi:hypothetical protein|nr:amino acid-binding domain protein [Evtepia sp.]
MLIEQISVFIENQPGRLTEVADVLAKNNVDITALSLADTSDFGILRLIVDQPDVAQVALRENGFIVKSTEVLAVAMDDQPGGLACVLHAIKDAGISIEYMYAFVGKHDGKAVVVMRVSDLDASILALKNDTSTVVNARDIYNV